MSENFATTGRPVRLPADTAREAVLGQHRLIRAALETACGAADAALGAEVFPVQAVATAVTALRAVMEAHLGFEEQVLLPILGDDLPLGPERAEHMLAEHREQRAALARLQSEAGLHPELPTLAAKLAGLASTLLADMEEEERSLLTRDALRDDVVAIGQDCG